MGKVFCFIGYSKAGKDYIAKDVLKRFPQLTEYAMGDYLKEIVCRMRGITREEFEAVKDEPMEPPAIFQGENFTMRNFPIDLAENLIKPVVGDFFVKKFFIDYEKTKSYLIKDVRYQVEYDSFKSSLETPIFIYIDRDPKFLNFDCGNVLTPNQCDYYFYNGKDDLEDLFSFIEKNI